MKGVAFLIAAVVLGVCHVCAGTLLNDISDLDMNSNKIEDGLEDIARQASPQETQRVIVMLNVFPSNSVLRTFTEHGGKVMHRFTRSIYGFSGTIPASRVFSLANGLGPDLAFIEADKKGTAHLDDSGRIIRVRPTVWQDYGTQGDSSTTVGILDTGVDDTHTDVSGKLVFWADLTTESKPSAIDENGHGTHVAGIVAGTGQALGSGAISRITTTHSGLHHTNNGWGWFDVVSIKTTGSCTLNMAFNGVGTAQLSCKDPNKNWMAWINSSTSPFSIVYNITTPGIYFPFSCNWSGLGGQPFSTLEKYPYQSVGDGFNLFTGVAPNVKLAGIKVMDVTGTFWSSDVIAGIDTIIVERDSKSIKVASFSGGLFNGGQNVAFRTAANSLPENGIVLVVSAGNDYPDYEIPDPGLANKVITIGATNDFGQMTGYSSNGPAGFDPKPDAVAPGGSYNSNQNVGSAITSLDTNDDDAHTPSFSDRNPNDYSNLYGTSMACPHVSGLAALIIDAQESLGNSYTYTEDEALEVKSIILLTSCETDSAGEASSGNDPPLNRGGKDRVEGYGRICADAAIEAVKLSLTFGVDETDTLSSARFRRKAWARNVEFVPSNVYDFNLIVPPTGDFDLYLYSSGHTSIGDPIIRSSSTQSGAGVDEQIHYELTSAETCYVVVKWVSGEGMFTLQSTSIGIQESAAALIKSRPLYVSPIPTAGALTLTFFAPEDLVPIIQIFDTSGRVVRTLKDSRTDRGIRTVTWDTRDNSGRIVSDGVYFARVSVGSVRQTAKAVILR